MKKELPYCKSEDAITGFENSTLAKFEKNDCVVRSFASAFNMTYDDAHNYVSNKFKRKTHKGVMFFNETMNKLSLLKTEVNGKTLERVEDLEKKVLVEGFSRTRRMSVGTFTKKYQKGTYIMSVRGHAFTIKDGVVIGNTEDAKKIRVIVESSWKVKD